MGKASAAAKLPSDDDPVRQHLLRLIAEHRKRKYEPLHLAIHFAHPKHKKDVCLFEVLGGFGDGRIDPKRSIFEVEFSSNPNFPMPDERDLRLFLTSPEELREAARARWASLKQLRDALQTEQADVLYSDRVGKDLLRLLR
ncbi:hypothetical protein BE08_15930 [Sorangium cellulosum]|uniref:Uncharacterized protein n=1 Tax=Sorangium cellulosum TaxID=56 RepID=A0A150PDN7_SORCE|nr:hypothetical protein BE08_15930 [Sorangium cellulosum]